ncbi:hypothetical protein PHMEG_00013081 [Phytophthora megakarya]|uniref:Uncharacterized protein n=1 Tax=Phytophthora megakarya TaxID=4795 RepID=A0A225W8N1_9STRA|nr:hypothetical protein PHMEG_00013081 [Phytophthora megakarya]
MLFHASILNDISGTRLAATMDCFGYYLATNDGKNGKLARHTAMLYFSNVKLWLFDAFPSLRVPTEMILLKQGRTLDKYCLKRERGGLVKAPPCTKQDLARTSSDYQDAALACLMWHCFGRSSDLGYPCKQHMSVSADGSAGEEQKQKETHTYQVRHHLLAVIDELIASNRSLSARFTIVEAALLSSKQKQAPNEQPQEQDTLHPESRPKRKKNAATNLSNAWFEWYTRVPRVWNSAGRQKKSEYRHVITVMKLFLSEGFALDSNASDYKDQVLDTGCRAEKAVIAFLKSRNVNAKGAGSVLRALCPLHKSGIFDDRIVAYKALVAVGRTTDPAPADTQKIVSARARTTALNAFERFAVAEGFGVNTIYEFVVYLAFKESSKGSLPPKNSVASYIGNFKNHLLELFNALGAVSGRQLQKIASILDKYCSKRRTDFTHQAAPCTKTDLRSLNLSILRGKGVRRTTRMQPSLIFCGIYCLFFRQYVSNEKLGRRLSWWVSIITFKRMKSARTKERPYFTTQMIFLLPNSCSSCSTLSEFCMDQLPQDTQEILPTEIGEAPLRELLDARTGIHGSPSNETPIKKAPVKGKRPWHTRIRTNPGLPSHSFRRGAAQNVNSDWKINTPWILDRGGFVARLPTFENFDHLLLHRIHLLQAKLFTAATGLTDRLSLRDDVVDVLTATAILHYPDMLHLSPDSLYAKRVQEALRQVQATEAEISAWAIAIHRTLQQPEKEIPSSPTPRRTDDGSLLQRQTWLLEPQAQLLGGLAAEVRELNQRVQRLEGHRKRLPRNQDPRPQVQPRLALLSRCKRVDISCAFSGEATRNRLVRVVLSPLPNARPNRRRYHECKVAVASIHFFLPTGYDVTGAESEAKERILSSGREAEAYVFSFLEGDYGKAKSHGTVVKVLKRMYAKGKLNDRIRIYLRLRQEIRVLEDASVHVPEPYNKL